MSDLTPSTLRTLARFHSGLNLVANLQHAEDVIRQQREGLAWAADEIERLQAELDRCKSSGPAVYGGRRRPRFGHDPSPIGEERPCPK